MMIRELGSVSRTRWLAAARAIDAAGRGVALLDGEGWGGSFLAMEPVDEQRVPLGPGALEEVARVVDRAAQPSGTVGWCGLRPAPRVIGYVAYEAARAIERPRWTRVEDRPAPIGAAAVLRRFAAVARRDERSGVVAIEGDDAGAIGRLRAAILASPSSAAPPPVLSLDPVDEDDAHLARIELALSLIAAGDLYQVCLARTFAGRSRATATELLSAMLTRATARFGAAIDCGDHALACSSPELFLDVSGRAVRTSPIKGTRPRGEGAAEDERLARELAHDPKEHAELTMVVDLERNDLGRIAEIGSVRVPAPARIETSRTVHHRVQDVVARVAPGVGAGAVLAATFPSGSVTGAPKVRAMEVIAELERDRRGIYCGAIVAISSDRSMRAAMAIRTLIADRAAEVVVYPAGGGIVEGSVPAREVAETRWKARQVVAPSP
ncbi:MAG: anthranilate synthase component I family protein [Deltaproteobacteria bacterium]|nr:anthranilate synthase component I family protein [Deltaproteobacteria bacterium]